MFIALSVAIAMAAAQSNCAPNPQAPVPCEGQLVGEVLAPAKSVGWQCPDYSVHWTQGDVSKHYVCPQAPKKPTVAAARVRLTKD